MTAISPTGQIPCLRHGDVALCESKSLATYIDKSFPGPKLIPEDAVGAARCEQWVSFGNAKVDRWIMREFIVPSVFFDQAKGPDTAKINEAVPEIDKCLAAIDGQLAKTKHIAGDALTYADLHLLPMLVLLEDHSPTKELRAKYPRVEAYVARLRARPSFTTTEPPPRTKPA